MIVYKAWTSTETKFLTERKAAGDSASVIGRDLKRTRMSVISKAKKLKLGDWKSTTKATDADYRRENRDKDRVQYVLDQARKEREERRQRNEEQRVRAKPPQLSKGDLRRMLEDAWRNTASAQ